jgi:hypothetical protein
MSRALDEALDRLARACASFPAKELSGALGRPRTPIAPVQPTAERDASDIERGMTTGRAGWASSDAQTEIQTELSTRPLLPNAGRDASWRQAPPIRRTERVEEVPPPISRWRKFTRAASGALHWLIGR